jgi:hypothetical protein
VGRVQTLAAKNVGQEALGVVGRSHRVAALVGISTRPDRFVAIRSWFGCAVRVVRDGMSVAILNRMRTFLIALVVAGALSAGVGCEGGPKSIEKDQLSRSRQSWEGIKARPTTHYRYTDRNSSFTGSTWDITTEVLNDQVTERSWVIKDRNGAVLDSWTETGAAIGSHTGVGPVLTIDGVYDGCESEVLSKDPATNLITLTFRDDGVLAVCTYFPKNCADDCAVGYHISTLELLD